MLGSCLLSGLFRAPRAAAELLAVDARADLEDAVVRRSRLGRDLVAHPRSAAREGGPENGVLTAAEDFVARREDLRLAVVPAFFGFGLVWHTGAPWAAAIAELVDPWDGNPLLRRLEENRVYHLAVSHARQVQLWSAQERLARRDGVLRRMLESSAFAVAERLSRIRVRLGIAPAQSVISKQEIRRALED